MRAGEFVDKPGGQAAELKVHLEKRQDSDTPGSAARAGTSLTVSAKTAVGEVDARAWFAPGASVWRGECDASADVRISDATILALDCPWMGRQLGVGGAASANVSAKRRGDEISGTVVFDGGGLDFSLPGGWAKSAAQPLHMELDAGCDTDMRRPRNGVGIQDSRVDATLRKLDLTLADSHASFAGKMVLPIGLHHPLPMMWDKFSVLPGLPHRSRAICGCRAR